MHTHCPNQVGLHPEGQKGHPSTLMNDYRPVTVGWAANKMSRIRSLEAMCPDTSMPGKPCRYKMLLLVGAGQEARSESQATSLILDPACLKCSCCLKNP